MKSETIKFLCTECGARFEELKIAEEQVFICLNCRSEKILPFASKNFCEKAHDPDFQIENICEDCQGCGH